MTSLNNSPLLSLRPFRFVLVKRYSTTYYTGKKNNKFYSTVVLNHLSYSRITVTTTVAINWRKTNNFVRKHIVLLRESCYQTIFAIECFETENNATYSVGMVRGEEGLLVV